MDFGPSGALDSLAPSRVRCRAEAGAADGAVAVAETALNTADRPEPSNRAGQRTPLREHVANSVRRYIGDLNGSGTDNLYEVALRELEIPLFVEVLNHCEGNQSRAAAMLGIHRATLRKKLRDYGLTVGD